MEFLDFVRYYFQAGFSRLVVLFIIMYITKLVGILTSLCKIMTGNEKFRVTKHIFYKDESITGVEKICELQRNQENDIKKLHIPRQRK